MSEQRADVPLDHDYDGIQEYDNRLPNWWLFTLYGSIVFSVGYWLFYETFAVGRNQTQAWEREEELAAQAQIEREMGKEVTEESLLLMTKVPAQLEAGAKIFQQKCVQCHGPLGAGEIGPNLTDGYWLHGPAPLQIYNTVMNGVLDKGMQAWKDQLGPVRVRQVVAHVLTISGKEVKGKAPQGRPTAEWEKERAAATPPAAPTDASAPPKTPNGK
ncbi:MAG: c-type cytochrome [Planctomycetota bacterium]|nr:c-type cytochrome [Planctomycetota bacterium]